jgi:hypothetical protein
MTADSGHVVRALLQGFAFYVLFWLNEILETLVLSVTAACLEQLMRLI